MAGTIALATTWAGIALIAAQIAKLESRKGFLCRQRGGPDKDGGQVLFYPDLTDAQCFDPDTDEPIESPRTR